MRGFVFLPLLLLCASCGQIGDPLPPALNIAMPVRDLRIVEYGDRLMIDFTIAPLTTEGLVLRRLGTVDLRIGPASSPFDQNRWADSARKIAVDTTATGAVHTAVPIAEWTGTEIIAAVRVVNPKGRASSWSNMVSLAVIPPVPAPLDVAAKAVPQGVGLSWRSDEHAFRVFRKGPDEKAPAMIAEPVTKTYADAGAQFGVEYTYMVQAIHDKAESPISAPVIIIAKDEFPPSVPAGLTAVAGIGVIELVWDRNTEPDLRGYRLYRATGAGSFERISEFTDAPAFSDRQIEAGKKYRYAVAALDLSGNESKMSAEIEVAAP